MKNLKLYLAMMITFTPLLSYSTEQLLSQNQSRSTIEFKIKKPSDEKKIVTACVNKWFNECRSEKMFPLVLTNLINIFHNESISQLTINKELKYESDMMINAISTLNRNNNFLFKELDAYKAPTKDNCGYSFISEKLKLYFFIKKMPINRGICVAINLQSKNKLIVGLFQRTNLHNSKNKSTILSISLKKRGPFHIETYSRESFNFSIFTIQNDSKNQSLMDVHVICLSNLLDSCASSFKINQNELSQVKSRISLSTPYFKNRNCSTFTWTESTFNEYVRWLQPKDKLSLQLY